MVVVTVPPYPVDACHFLYQLSEVPDLEGDVLAAEGEVEGVAAELPVEAAEGPQPEVPQPEVPQPEVQVVQQAEVQEQGAEVLVLFQ